MPTLARSTSPTTKQQESIIIFKNMPNQRRGLWKAIKRRGKEGVSTGSAASTVEESVSCGTFGSAPKPTLQGQDHFSNADLQEFRLELIERASTARLSGPVDVDEFLAEPHTNPRLLSNDPIKEQNGYQFRLSEDGQRRLCVHTPTQQQNVSNYRGPVDVDNVGPVDVDAFIQDDTSTSTTSEERAEIMAIRGRLQSRNSSKLPRNEVLVDSDDHEASLVGYEDGFGTLFDDVYHNPDLHPFDEAPMDEYHGSLSSKAQSRTRVYYVKIPASTLGRMGGPSEKTSSEFTRSFEYRTESNVFEC